MTAGRARVLQRLGRARVRKLVKMAERMPAEAKRPSALEVTSVTRKTLEVYAALRPLILRLERLVGGQQRGSFGSGHASHGVHEPGIFSGPRGLERREIAGKCPLLLSNLLAAGGGIDWLGASCHSKDGRRRRQISREERSQRQSGRFGRGDV